MEQGKRVSVKDEELCLTSDIWLLTNEQFQELIDETIYQIHNPNERMAIKLLLIKAKRFEPTGMKRYLGSEYNKYICPGCGMEIRNPNGTVHFCSRCGQHLTDGKWQEDKKAWRS